MEAIVAEAKSAPPTSSPPPATSSGQKPTLFIILTLLNLGVVVGVGVMMYLGQKKKAVEPGIEQVIEGEHKTQKEEEKDTDFIGKLVPMETFLVNLAQSRGRKLAKINMEFEVGSDEVQQEIEKLKPRIRDMVIMIISDKNMIQLSSKEGKDNLRAEIRNQVNLFLSKGQIKNVYFTEFIYN
ncbi:MAG: flagellar basal body-associated FliL family protein [Bdellovibrionales bacterium]|nr:flagellar basal body-associated FliL family protein [Bdellovibrionales bacterium]